jgi:hypothetical protein
MRNIIFTIFKILIAIVLFGKLLGIVLNFSNGINQILNIAMFSLIGISYVVIGYIWDDKISKTLFITCGLYLIIMNFFQSMVVLNILSIVCILTPMLLSYFNMRKQRDMSIS